MNRTKNAGIDGMAFGPPAEPKNHAMHWIFWLLRLAALGGAFLWTVTVADPTRVRSLLILLAVFVAYSLVLLGIFLCTAVRVDSLYRIAMACDASFIFFLVEAAGERGEVFLLAYSLLVGVHACYFGLRTGLLLSGSCSVLLAVHSQLGSILDRPPELLFVVGLLILLGGTLGFLTDRRKIQNTEMRNLIQELQQTGTTLKQAERIAMLGRLTSSIAHEINNPISAILTRLQCMLQDAQDQGRNDATVADLEVLLAQSRRLADTSGKLLRFARPAPASSEHVDINACIERAVQWIEHRLPEKQLTLNLNLSSGLPRVPGRASDLEEGIVNLLTNAIDACALSGQIYVISALSGSREKTLQILVADTGNGIAEEDLDRVFDPFFTTKKVGKGTGLGLFITHEVVREHYGTIEVETESGKGTTFIVNLPVPPTP